LWKAERDNLITDVSISRGGPRISHLFFAVLLFKIYLLCGALGQKINSDKTTIFFSHNTSMATRDDIVDFFGTSPTTKFEKYLGLPPVIGRAKKKAFQEIKDRVWKKLQGWKEKLLSQAGREVLLKVVIQAIPTYAMSVFKFPAGLCEEISAMANSFWWGQWRAGRKIHWLNKKELVRAKSDGGMGFKDLQLFNRALLAKQLWRLLQNSNSLVHRFLKSKYFPHTNDLEATVRGNASYLW
jgi:hypothetical protein